MASECNSSPKWSEPSIELWVQLLRRGSAQIWSELSVAPCHSIVHKSKNLVLIKWLDIKSVHYNSIICTATLVDFWSHLDYIIILNNDEKTTHQIRAKLRLWLHRNTRLELKNNEYRALLFVLLHIQQCQWCWTMKLHVTSLGAAYGIIRVDVRFDLGFGVQ